MRTIDINCDCGESFGNWRLGADEQVMPEITTANVACGFHGGDPVTMLETARLAKAHGVVVGAHPGLPDLLGFGRRVLAVTPEDAYAYTVFQVGALQAVLAANGMTLHHVKPHGALYVMLNESRELAVAVADAIVDVMPEPMLYWPASVAGAAFPAAARERGIRLVSEIYPDLEYLADGRFVIQREKRATDLERAKAQVARFLRDGTVEATDGTLVPFEAESVCIHGDGPNALDVVRAVREAIEESGCVVGSIDRAAAGAGA